MNLQEMYKKKLMSAEDAVKLIKNNTEVWIGIAVPVPLALVNALGDREPEVENITINHIVDVHAQFTWH